MPGLLSRKHVWHFHVPGGFCRNFARGFVDTAGVVVVGVVVLVSVDAGAAATGFGLGVSHDAHLVVPGLLSR